MTPDNLVKTVAPKIGNLGAIFYFHPDTVAKGKELGLDGFRFYFLGRGGVLGDVEAPVVASAFGYFNPGLVQKMWTTAKEKLAPREAARVYLGCLHDLARRKLDGVECLESFNAAAEAVNAAIDPSALALYSGIAAEPLPEDAPARALHLIDVLREFRWSAHLLAVVASGLSPRVAHAIKRPADVKSFGWGEETPEISDEDRAKLDRAEELTDRIVLPAFSVLDESQAKAFVEGIDAIEAAFAAS